MHNPAKLEIQQERKRFLSSQRAACRSERMEERKTDRSMGEGVHEPAMQERAKTTASEPRDLKQCKEGD